MNSHPSFTADTSPGQSDLSAQRRAEQPARDAASAQLEEHEAAVRLYALQLAAQQVTSAARRQLFPFLCALALLCAAPLSAQVPGILGYQGRVLVGNTNFTGTGHFKFALTGAAGTTTFWSHNGSLATSEPTNAVALPVDKGLFAVNLGEPAVPNMTQAIPSGVFENSAVHLKVWFSPDNVTFTVLTPSLRIAANGYALNAAQAESVRDGSITTAKLAPNLALTTSGSVSAAAFNGSGSGLTNLNAANLTGSLPDARLSANVALLNGGAAFAGSVTAPSFSGNGAGLTNLSTANLTGTLPDVRLSVNVALLASSPVFTGTVTAARFVGDGSGLTNVPSSLIGAGSIGTTQLADGAVTSAKLAANLAFSTTGSITAGSFTGSGAGLTNLAATNLTGALTVTTTGEVGIGVAAPTNKLEVSGTVKAGAFVGDGSGLTNLPVATLADNVVTTAKLADGAVTGAKLSGSLAITTTGAVTASSFSGNGTGLTNLSAANLASGTLPDARLSANVALLSSAPAFTGAVTAARFIGDGSGLTNIPGGIVGAGSIGTTQLADGAVTSAKLAANLSLTTTGAITAGSFTGGLASTNLTGALTVTAAGNLGVGITAPAFKLDVNGGGRFQGDLPLVLQNPGNAEEGGKLVLADAGKSLTSAYDGAWMLDVVDTDYFRISRPDIYDVLTATRDTKIVGLANDSLTVNSVNGRVGIGVESPANKLEVNGTVKATAFVGDGSGLTNLAAATLSDGSVTTAKLADSAVTTAKLADGTITGAKLSSSIAITTSGAVSAASFSGDGASLNNLSAGNLSSGTLADARLSSNVPLLNGSPTFTGAVTASGFTGNGANLTNLSAANLASGALADARLSANIPRLDTAAAFTSTVTATAFTGSGAALTNLSAANLSAGTLADARLSSNVPLLNGSPTFTGAVTASSFTGSGANLTSLSAANISSGALADARLSSNIPRLNTAAAFTSTVTATAFTGSGASLTNLSAANLSSGSLADARLSSNVPLLNGSQTFTGSPTFSGPVALSTNLNVDSGTLYVDAANGRVGVGTTSPSVPWEVSSSSQVVGLVKGSATTGTWLNLQNTSSGGATWNFVSSGSGNGEGAGRLLLRDNASGTRMTFDTAGNVGIGTTSPANKLDVAGTFQATGNATLGGTVSVAGNFTVDTTALHVNAANNYVGIGTVTPIAMLHIKGTNDYLSLQNSVGSDIFSVDSNGRLALNTSVGSTATALVRAVSGDTDVLKVQTSTGTDLVKMRADGRMGINNTYNNVGLNVRGVSGDTLTFNVENTSGSSMFTVNPSGNVGIGTTSPSAKLDVSGTVRCTSLTQTSDRRLKHDIAPLGSMLEKVTSLKPATYRYNADEPAQPVRIGFIAQEVAEVLPELVDTNPDHLSLSYNGFGVVAIKAIQEQQAQIESLKAESAKKDALLTDLAKRLAELEARMK